MVGDIAVAHDQFVNIGGAELAAFVLARTFDCPIYAMEIDEDTIPDDIDIHRIGPDGLIRKFVSGSRFHNKLVRALSWQSVPELYDYDTIIVNKLDAGYFIPRDDQTIIWNVHSTPRAGYDLFHRSVGGTIDKLVQWFWRILYETNLSYPDKIVANSDLVKRRIEKYWGVPKEKIHVIYEPVEVEELKTESDYDHKSDERYYLSISRLARRKRIEEIVTAFNDLNQMLVVAGEGPRRAHLERLAGDNVEFVGSVWGEEKREYLAGAEAIIVNAVNEDFGMTPIEAFACGTPVIGVRDGFTQYQIIDGENGILFERGVKSLHQAVTRFESENVAWDRQQFEEFASCFSIERYRARFREVVGDAEARAEVHVPWNPID